MTTNPMLKLLAESDHATGIDLNHYEGDFNLMIGNPDVVAAVDFVVLRVGYGAADGKNYMDSKFLQQYNELTEHPEIRRGGYWYFSSQVPWEKQRDDYLRFVEGLELDFHCGDFERAYNTKSAGFATTFIRWLKHVRDETSRLAGRDLKMFLYSDKYMYNDWLLPYTQESNDFPFWLAQYPWVGWNSITTYFLNWWSQWFANFTDRPSLPNGKGPADWEIWQMVDKSGLGEEIGLTSDQIDINITRRKRDEFFDFLGTPARLGGDPVPTDPPPVELAPIVARLEAAENLLFSLDQQVDKNEEGLGSLGSEIVSLGRQLNMIEQRVDALETETTQDPPSDYVEKTVDRNGENVYLSFEIGQNNDNKPIFEFYPSDVSQVRDRVFVPSGAVLRVIPGSRTVGDGGVAVWYLNLNYPVPRAAGSAPVPDGVALAVREKFIK